jgi:hypothetical protein
MRLYVITEVPWIQQQVAINPTPTHQSHLICNAQTTTRVFTKVICKPLNLPDIKSKCSNTIRYTQRQYQATGPDSAVQATTTLFHAGTVARPALT